MNRTDRWLDDLRTTLGTAAELVARGRNAFDEDPAVPLAFEALANRVGELAKRLRSADSVRFSAQIWTLAARNRDFVVHHYDRIDSDALWITVTRDLPTLAALIEEV